MLAQTVQARQDRVALYRKVFSLAVSIMPTMPLEQIKWKSFKIMALRSMTGAGVNVRRARLLFKAAYKSYRRSQRDGVGQHQRH